MDFMDGYTAAMVFPIPVGAWTYRCFSCSIALYTYRAISFWPFLYSNGNSMSEMD